MGNNKHYYSISKAVAVTTHRIRSFLDKSIVMSLLIHALCLFVIPIWKKSKDGFLCFVRGEDIPSNSHPERLLSTCDHVAWTDACDRVNANGGGERRRRRRQRKRRMHVGKAYDFESDPIHDIYDPSQMNNVSESTNSSFRTRRNKAIWMISDQGHSVYDTNCLPLYRLQLHGSMTIPYYANQKLFAGGNQSTALIVQHGTSRDSDVYYCTIRKLLMAYHANSSSDVVVIAPTFHYQGDPNMLPSDVYWNTTKPWGDWRLGAESDPTCCSSSEGMTSATIGSFDILDYMVQVLMQRDLYPNLSRIVMLGHSAGAQMIQRYALVSSYLTKLDHNERTKLQFIVANPSSYTYLENHRYAYNCGECSCNSDECTCPEICTKPLHHHATLPDNSDIGSEWPCYDAQFDDWPYGLSAITNKKYTVPYLIQSHPANVAQLYQSCHMIYLVGQNDTCNDNLIECDPSCATRTNGCSRSLMDTRCPAILEGPNRKVRAIRYMNFLKDYYGSDTHQLHIIPNVGHDVTGMFASEIMLKTILYGKQR